MKNKQLKKSIDSGKIVVVKVYTDKCGPCVSYVSTFKKFSDECGVETFSVDGASDYDFVAGYGIRSVPTTIFFKGGLAVKKLGGVQSLEDLNLTLEEYRERS